jgi:transposase
MSTAVLSTSTSTADDGGVSGSSPRAGGPSRRRSFTPTEKLEHLLAYEAACQRSEGGAYLRREGLYSSLIFEWRQLRDAGLLEGKPAGATIGRPSPEQAEIARLRRQLDQAQRRLATTETALEIMGKAHALLEQVSEGADIETPRRRR